MPWQAMLAFQCPQTPAVSRTSAHKYLQQPLEAINQSINIKPENSKYTVVTGNKVTLTI